MEVDLALQRARHVMEYWSWCLTDEIWTREAMRWTQTDDRKGWLDDRVTDR